MVKSSEFRGTIPASMHLSEVKCDLPNANGPIEILFGRPPANTVINLSACIGCRLVFQALQNRVVSVPPHKVALTIIVPGVAHSGTHTLATDHDEWYPTHEPGARDRAFLVSSPQEDTALPG